MKEAIGVGFVRIDEGGAQCFSGLAIEIGFGAVGNLVSGTWVAKTDFFGVKAETWKICARVKCVAEDGKPAEFSVNADLVGAAGEWMRLDEVELTMIAGNFAVVIELGFGGFAAGAADVAIAIARDAGLDGEFFLMGMFGGEKDVTFEDLAIRELLGQGLVGDF